MQRKVEPFLKLGFSRESLRGKASVTLFTCDSWIVLFSKKEGTIGRWFLELRSTSWIMKSPRKPDNDSSLRDESRYEDLYETVRERFSNKTQQFATPFTSPTKSEYESCSSSANISFLSEDDDGNDDSQTISTSNYVPFDCGASSVSNQNGFDGQQVSGYSSNESFQNSDRRMQSTESVVTLIPTSSKCVQTNSPFVDTTRPCKNPFCEMHNTMKTEPQCLNDVKTTMYTITTHLEHINQDLAKVDAIEKQIADLNLQLKVTKQSLSQRNVILVDLVKKVIEQLDPEKCQTKNRVAPTFFQTFPSQIDSGSSSIPCASSSTNTVQCRPISPSRSCFSSISCMESVSYDPFTVIFSFGFHFLTLIFISWHRNWSTNFVDCLL